MVVLVVVFAIIVHVSAKLSLWLVLSTKACPPTASRLFPVLPGRERGHVRGARHSCPLERGTSGVRRRREDRSTKALRRDMEAAKALNWGGVLTLLAGVSKTNF